MAQINENERKVYAMVNAKKSNISISHSLSIQIDNDQIHIQDTSSWVPPHTGQLCGNAMNQYCIDKRRKMKEGPSIVEKLVQTPLMPTASAYGEKADLRESVKKGFDGQRETFSTWSEELYKRIITAFPLSLYHFLAEYKPPPAENGLNDPQDYYSKRLF